MTSKGPCSPSSQYNLMSTPRHIATWNKSSVAVSYIDVSDMVQWRQRTTWAICLLNLTKRLTWPQSEMDGMDGAIYVHMDNCLITFEGVSFASAGTVLHSLLLVEGMPPNEGCNFIISWAWRGAFHALSVDHAWQVVIELLYEDNWKGKEVALCWSLFLFVFWFLSLFYLSRSLSLSLSFGFCFSLSTLSLSPSFSYLLFLLGIGTRNAYLCNAICFGLCQNPTSTRISEIFVVFFFCFDSACPMPFSRIFVRWCRNLTVSVELQPTVRAVAKVVRCRSPRNARILFAIATSHVPETTMPRC